MQCHSFHSAHSGSPVRHKEAMNFAYLVTFFPECHLKKNKNRADVIVPHLSPPTPKARSVLTMSGVLSVVSAAKNLSSGCNHPSIHQGCISQPVSEHRSAVFEDTQPVPQDHLMPTVSECLCKRLRKKKKKKRRAVKKSNSDINNVMATAN